GDILDFNRNRIDLGHYALVSPIADDALDHYRYRLLDTLATGGRRVFRLAIVPRGETSPLFTGLLDIGDSTYEGSGLDLGVNSAARFNLIRNLRYSQRLEDVGGGRWMPRQIRISGELKFDFPGIPRLGFEHAATLDSFRFDQGSRPPDIDYRIAVDEGAD